MANRFWVGGTATWDNTAGSKWATTSGGAGGAAVPTNADDVYLDANSGANTVTLATGRSCRSIDCTGFTGTFSHPSSVDFFIGDGTAGASNIALKFVAGMTYTLGSGTTSTLSFQSTSATQQTVDWGGKTCGLVTFGTGASGGNYQLISAMTSNTASTIGLSRGTVDTNGQTCSWGLFSSNNSNTRTLTLGASQITLTGSATSWNTATTTNMTFNAGTSSLIFNPTAAASPTPSMGNLTYYNVSCIKSAGGFVVTATNGVTFNNFTMDNTVVGSGNRILQITAATAITVNINGVITYKANNATASRGRFVSGARGLTLTIALGTTGTAAMTDIDFEDITFTGTNTPVTAAGGRLADGGGNSGITFAAPVTYYWIGNGGAMATVTKYSTTSGGAAGAVVPLVHDVLVFDANSITSGSQTITNDMMRMPGLDFTNVLNNPVYNPRNTNAAGNAIYGSFIMKTGMTVSDASAAGGVTPHVFAGRSIYNLNFAGVDMLTTFSYSITAPSGTYSLQSDITLGTARTLTLTNGTFDANGYNVTTGAVSASVSTIRTLTMGSGTWTLTGTGTVWQFSTMTNLTFNSDTSTLVISDTSASTKTFAHGASITMYNVSITGSGSGSVIFGANSTSINDLTINAPKTVSFTAGSGSTTTIRNNFNAVGTAGNVITLVSGTPGSAFFLSKSSGAVISDYLSLTDSSATGGASWYAGANSTNVSNNRGWQFSNQDVSKANFFQMM